MCTAIIRGAVLAFHSHREVGQVALLQLILETETAVPQCELQVSDVWHSILWPESEDL